LVALLWVQAQVFLFVPVATAVLALLLLREPAAILVHLLKALRRMEPHIRATRVLLTLLLVWLVLTLAVGLILLHLLALLELVVLPFAPELGVARIHVHVFRFVPVLHPIAQFLRLNLLTFQLLALSLPLLVLAYITLRSPFTRVRILLERLTLVKVEETLGIAAVWGRFGGRLDIIVRPITVIIYRPIFVIIRPITVIIRPITVIISRPIIVNIRPITVIIRPITVII